MGEPAFGDYVAEKGERQFVKDWEGFYEVSSLGRVRSLTRLVHQGHPNSKPVLKEGQILCLVVAQAFIPNPDNLPEINHKDLDPLNNEVSNLEWCTRSQNVTHAYRNGRAPKLNPDKIRRIRELSSFGHSNRELGRQFEVSGGR
jgi:hypothetical protein